MAEPERSRVMAVRLGERSFEEVLAEIEEVQRRLTKALEQTALPEEPDREANHRPVKFRDMRPDTRVFGEQGLRQRRFGCFHRIGLAFIGRQRDDQSQDRGHIGRRGAADDHDAASVDGTGA